MSHCWPLPGQIIDETSKTENIIPQQSLESLRDEIDEIDSELAVLLSRRFVLTQEIGQTKAKLGRKIKDEAREEKVLEKVSRSLSGESSRDFILNVFRSLIKESVDHQEACNASDDSRSRVERLFPNVCVIGAGLIGGALSRQVKACFPSSKLHAVDLPNTLAPLQESKIFESCSAKLERKQLEQASLILIACPPDVSLKVMTSLAPLLSPGQLVVDLCSVKKDICDLAEELDLNGAEFVGAHPFFGTEKSGFENSAELQLRGRTLCLVPTSKSSELSIARLKLWFANMDLRVFITNAESHDSTVAITSHLVQLIASALGSVIHDELLETGKEDHLALSGGALAGLARLMSSRPDMWTQICHQNRNEIDRMLQKLSKELKSLISENNEDCRIFAETFSKAAKVRSALEAL